MNKDRMLLAVECAEALGIKPLSPLVSEFKVKISDFPTLPPVGNVVGPTEYRESSLLSMGVVYSYGTNFTFIDESGHTCLLPYSEEVKKELERCGYVVCEYGEPSPNFGDSVENERQIRSKVTLPQKLVTKIVGMESIGSLEPCVVGYGDNAVEYPYDVFGSGLYRGVQFGFHEIEAILEEKGYDTETSRKFAAITGYAGASITTLTRNANDLREFFIRSSAHPIIAGTSAVYEDLVTIQNKEKAINTIATTMSAMTPEELNILHDTTGRLLAAQAAGFSDATGTKKI